MTVLPSSPVRSSRRIALAGCMALAAVLAPAAPAAAAPEPVIGGSTKLTLELPKGIKASAIAPATADGATITFPNAGGKLEPASGAGTVDVAGGIKFKGKGGRLSFQATKAGYGPNGSLRGLVGSKSVDLATVTGGAATTQASSVDVSGGNVLLTAEGAKALSKKLAKKKRKKRAAASGSKPFKTGARLGALSTTAPFATVQVLAQGEMELVPDIGTALKFASKGVSPLTGVVPVAPATSPMIGEFFFPITGGRLLPDLTGGQIETGGGLRITKTDNVNASCDAARPVGTFVRQIDLIADLTRRSLRATVDGSAGFVGAGTDTATLDLSGATSNVNPSTGAFSISDVGVVITGVSAATLNTAFGSAAQGCGNDFAGGDPLGTISVTGQVRQ